IHRQGRVRQQPAAAGVEELQRHQPHVLVDAGHADAVAADRPDDAGDVGAVAVVVGHVGRVGYEVPAVHVVHEAAVVVVDAVAVGGDRGDGRHGAGFEGFDGQTGDERLPVRAGPGPAAKNDAVHGSGTLSRWIHFRGFVARFLRRLVEGATTRRDRTAKSRTV